MKVTVCELGNGPSGPTRDWPALIAHAAREKSDLILLDRNLAAPGGSSSRRKAVYWE